MSNDYTFFDMLGDMLFNGNKVSKGRDEDDDEDCREAPWGGFGRDSSSSSSSSGEFDPSDAAGEAFRSVFGNDG